MVSRRPLRLPITLGIMMIVLLVALTVGWILMVFLQDAGPGLYWVMLPVGITFLVLVLVGTILYLTLSIKAINLNRRQSNFIDSVTHELKSPIASLKLYLQTLSLRPVTDDERKGFYGYMLEDVERLDQLINHLLEAARLDRDAGDEDGEIEMVNLADLLADCADTVCLAYQLPEQTITTRLSACSVQASRVDLDMIFRNLIDNAVKYAGDPPQVEVTLSCDRQTGVAHVRIADNGPGIPRGLRRKIFGRFVRLGSELRRKRPGTGLGLYIVRTLVRRMRGRIRIHDAEQGIGTVFAVELPNASMNVADNARHPIPVQKLASPRP